MFALYGKYENVGLYTLLTLLFEHFLFNEQTWHPQACSCSLPMSSMSSFKMTHLIGLSWPEVRALMQSHPAYSELESVWL